MKIRTGFVSNSSSSSFVIYGSVVEMEDIVKHFGKEKEYENDSNFETYELVDKLEGELGDDFTIRDVHEDGELHVGREWATIGDDETGKQFKESVENKLKEVFKKDIKCETYDEVIQC